MSATFANPKDISREAARECSALRAARFRALTKCGRDEYPCVRCGQPERWMCPDCELFVCGQCRKEGLDCNCQDTFPPSTSATTSSKAAQASQASE